MSTPTEYTPRHFNELEETYLPSYLGINIVELVGQKVTADLRVEQKHLAPNGYMHAGTVITLADTACGYGCVSTLPEGARNFTTVELKSNFLGTAVAGDTIICQAEAVHNGRSTQLWDATVTSRNSGRTIALFRCTQMILYPR